MTEQRIPFQAEQPKECARAERRASVRFLSGRQVYCQALAASTTHGWLGRFRDISRSGIALILSQRFAPGTLLIIELATKAGYVRRLPARVAHATLDTNGPWVLGCAFAATLSQQELQTFLGE
jgi:hypothetical protein